jgi:WD40 repeat protein
LAVPFLGHSDQVECATFSPDGKWLASGDSSGVIILWRVEDGQPVRTLSLQPK